MDDYKIVKCKDPFETSGQIEARAGVNYVERHLIAQNYETAKVVYFVSGNNGDEFGQFPTLEEALECLRSIK